MKNKIICSGNSNHEKAYVCGDACYGVDCDVHDVISVMRVYDGVLVK